MKKFATMAISVALIGAMVAGGSLAYLSDTDSDVNVMTLGKVEIEQLEYERVVENGAWVSTGETDKYGYTPDKLQEFTQEKPLYPAVFADGVIKWDDRNGSTAEDGTGHQQSWAQVGASGSNQLFDDSVKNVQDKFVFVKNTGKSDAYVRTLIALEQGSIEADNFENVIMMNNNSNHWEWETVATDVVITNPKDNTTSEYFVVTATYLGPKSSPTGILAPDTVSYPSLLQVYMKPEAGNKEVEAIDGNKNGTYDVLVLSQAVQTAGFEPPAAATISDEDVKYGAEYALNTAFGDTTVENIQAWFGHVWEEQTAEPSATGEEMLAALKTLPGDDGADITASVTKVIYGKIADYPEIVNGGYENAVVNDITTYYKPVGDKYEVYMLSEDMIYAPEDCSGLFRDMTALTEVDLSNLDMSTATTAQNMFRGCAALTTIGDVSNWDVSNLKSTRSMFNGCSKLESLDVSSWDVSNVQDAGWMFYNCQSVSELDVADWDTSSFTFTKSMFYNNTKLTELDVENWDMSDVTDTSYMFSYCTTLGNVDLSKWDVSNVQYFNNMFKHARAMDTLDLSTWDTSSAVDMNHMFANCGKLVNLDISGFDTSKVTTMGWMFYEVEAEKIYVGDKWSLESIANLDEGVYSHKIATAPLVGGEGTTCRQIMDLDSKCVAENGARINATARYMIPDGGESNPGLLTYKAN